MGTPCTSRSSAATSTQSGSVITITRNSWPTTTPRSTASSPRGHPATGPADGREGLDEQTVTTIRDTFNDHLDVLLRAMPEGKDNAKYENAKIVNVTDNDYDDVRKMYQAVGVNDFSRFLGD